MSLCDLVSIDSKELDRLSNKYGVTRDEVYISCDKSNIILLESKELDRYK